MQKQVKLDAFQNVVASGIAICDLNKFLGQVLEKMTFTLGGTAFTRSMITYMAIKANNKVIWESDGAKLNASNLYNGATDDATILKIDFMDRKGVSLNSRQAGALDLSSLSGVSQLRMEVTISGATAPTLTGLADVSPATNDPNEAAIRALVARRHRNTQVIGAAGEFALQVPHVDPSAGGSNYRRIYIYCSNLTKLKSVRDGVTEHDVTKAENEAAQKDNFKAPQAGLVVFDPCQDGRIFGTMWDTRKGVVGSATLYGTFSAGETINIETEELIGLGAY